MLRESEVTVSGVRSPVVQTGPEGVPEAIVLVHGNPGRGADWAPIMEAAGAFARTVALDMPGFGAADKPASFPYTVPGYAAHLQGALAQLGVTRAHLVLHDFGGPWGLQWAVDHPDAHASTTLINPPALPLDYADRMFDMYADKGTRRAVLRLYRATEIEPHVAAIAPRLRENPRPTLVAWGGKDPYLKVRLAQRQREVFRDATVIELPDSGHWSLADDPQAVLNAVVPFLRDQVAGAVPLRD